MKVHIKLTWSTYKESSTNVIPNNIYFRCIMAQMVKNLPAMRKTWVQSLDWEDSLENGMATPSNTLAWRIPGQRSLAGYSPWGHKESDMTEQPTFHFHSFIESTEVVKWISYILNTFTLWLSLSAIEVIEDLRFFFNWFSLLI